MTARILAVCDFVDQPLKFERHIAPLAKSTDVTVICITPSRETEGVTYLTVPTIGLRIIGLMGMFILAVVESARADYDGVISFSLVPHGCIGLVTARLSGIPVHLGIIGVDLDVHADSWYGPLIKLLLRRFDAISVPGISHARQLERCGVDPARVRLLTHPIDVETYRPPSDDIEPVYDFLWIGRFSPEKRPFLFLQAISTLVDSKPSVRAAMLGDGPLFDAVQSDIADRGLEGVIDQPGWIDNPLDYYHRSRIFVLTSRRDALPLTLIEAMATGLGCVVPDVGNIRDVAIDQENAIVLEEMTADCLASTLHRLKEDPGVVEQLGARAARIRSEFTYDEAAKDWRRILRVMDVC